jgi:DNA-binding GntR family transcriptional regulator
MNEIPRDLTPSESEIGDEAPVKRRTRSTVTRIFDSLSRDILEGTIAPGQRLVAANLVEEFGVSRGPIREALRRLAAEGLVELRFNYGARVRMLSREEIRVINEAREIIESGAASLAAQRFAESDRQVEFEAICTAMERAAAEGAKSTFLALNTAFHELLLTIAGNPALRDIWRQLHVPALESQLDAVPFDTYMLLAQEEHRAIIAAVREGDPAAARDAMRQHLGRQTVMHDNLPDAYFAPKN